MRHLPTRQRPNSGKTLLAFRLSGEIAKRTIPVQGGVIEFLGTGNQFVAIGTHPSGVHYDWVGGLPYEIPEISLVEFEEVWAELIKVYATGEPTGSEISARKKGDNVVAPDPVADFLEAEGLILGTDRDGSLIVACPWSADHTTGEAGDSSTMWFRAGTKGYERGHFKCLHGHCQSKADGDFFTAIGYTEPADTFEPVVLDAAEMLEVQNAGPILRKGRGGYPRAHRHRPNRSGHWYRRNTSSGIGLFAIKLESLWERCAVASHELQSIKFSRGNSNFEGPGLRGFGFLRHQLDLVTLGNA